MLIEKKTPERSSVTKCLRCAGTGEVHDAGEGDIFYRVWTCPDCNGTGMPLLEYNKESNMITTPSNGVEPTGVEHEVKSWTHFFQAIKRGDKMHDMRDLKDRVYRVGDILILNEYDPFTGAYSGDTCRVMVTYITSADTPCAFSSSALAAGFCILSLRLV